MNETSHRSISTGELLMALSEKKWRHLLVLLLVFTASVWFFRYYVLSYTSSTTIVVIDGLKYDGRGPEKSLPDYLMPTDQFNRVLQVVNSTEMYDHLIRRFKLYTHYGIDTTAEFRYEKVIRRLRSKIDVKKTPYNSVTITVRDAYRYVAYEMANEIATYANELNRKQLLVIQRKRVNVYEKTYAKLSDIFAARRIALESTLNRFPATESNTVKSSENELSQAVHQLSRTVDEFSSTVREQQFILEALKESNSPTIVQQQRALPSGDSLLLPSIGISLLAVLLCSFLQVLFTYLRLQYKEHYSFLSKNKNQ